MYNLAIPPLACRLAPQRTAVLAGARGMLFGPHERSGELPMARLGDWNPQRFSTAQLRLLTAM